MEARKTMAWQPAPELKADAERPLAERSWLQGVDLPVQRDIAVLFVDMVDSTGMIERYPPKRAFALLQTFMDAIVQVGVNHCGDVRDFEGDGAMLYFAGLGEALPAAFAIRERLNELRAKDSELPMARYAITAGSVLAGFVGTDVRRSLLFVGRPVHTAARLLKLAKPGGIVTTKDVLVVARESNPDLADQFAPSVEASVLKGFQKEVVIWHA
jgi:class 3 adenylate cyclase